MINFNTQLSQANALWILNDVFPKAGYRINHQTLAPWRDAHNLAFSEQVGIPGCSCEYIQTYNVWNSRLSQYEQQIRDIAYPPIVEEKPTRGRKKK
jgi:hypothetical protein